MAHKTLKILSVSILMAMLLDQHVYADNFPMISAESYLVIDASSGRIVDSKNPDRKLPMASTTKIMTAILAIDVIDDLESIVSIPAYCTNIEGSSIYLKAGQNVKIMDLLYGTMLRSGNDAAVSLANFGGGGDLDRFIDMMNQKAYDLGAYNTNFKNPNGLHDKEHYTTAYDLALITKYAMENEIFRQVSSAKSYKAERLNTTLYNKNKVVHDYEFGTGVKIGYTQAAGRCLVASAKKDNAEFIVVLINDPSWFDDAYKIFDWAFEKYKSYSIVEADQYIMQDETGSYVLANEGFTYVLDEGEVSNIKFKIEKTPPYMSSLVDGKICGTYKVYLKDEIIFSGLCKYAN